MKNNDDALEATEAEIQGGKIVETTKPLHEPKLDEKQPLIKRGRVDSLNIYEIKEDELNTIEKGSSSSLHLNFSVFFTSIAASFLIALLTSDFKEKTSAFIVFVVVTVVGFAIGLILFVMWLREKDDSKEVIKIIRQRMKE